MSTITAFFGSVGSTSPNALPTIFSYWPTPGQEKPPKVGVSLAVTWVLVMRASAAAAISSVAVETTSAILRRVGVRTSASWFFVAGKKAGRVSSRATGTLVGDANWIVGRPL